MPRLIPLALALAMTVLAAGCQIGLPGPTSNGPTSDDVTANAVAGDAIEVTALDDTPTAAAPLSEGGAEATAPPQGAAPATVPPDPEDGVDPAPQPDLDAEVAPTPKSERQQACEKRGGTWARTGAGALRTCVFPTKDGGKQCSRESQCDGVCLARSGTCAPVKPLLGCNEILQDNGARVTLCIE